MRMIMEQFSRWLQAEMNKRHWNQTDLAKRAGFFPSSLSRVLRGDRKLGIDMAVGIARALKVRTERVLYEAGLIPEMPTEDVILEEIDAILEGWTKRDQQVWLELTRVRDSQIERGDGVSGNAIAGRRTARDAKLRYGASEEPDETTKR